MVRQIPIHYKSAVGPSIYTTSPLDELSDRYGGTQGIQQLEESSLVEESGQKEALTPIENELPQDNTKILLEKQHSEATGTDLELPDKERLQQELSRALEREQTLLKEFRNFRKHSQQTMANVTEKSKREILAEMSDVLHALELAANSSNHDPDKVIEGLKLIADNLEKVFSKYGLERIPTRNSVFDPELHEAVLAETGTGIKKGTVIRELSPGFRNETEIIRPAKVVVAV